MQIVALPSYLAPAVSSLPVRPVASTASALTRAALAPARPSPALGDEQAASAREEADRSSESSTQSAGKQDKAETSPQQQRLEQLEIAELATRDRQVRAHEQAHAAVGGSYAGAPSYTYTHGPDGQRYAVAGEVSIDTSAVANDPQATLSKMEIVVRAALAPAEPTQPSGGAEPASRRDDPEASRQPSHSSAADLDLYRRTAELQDSAP